LDIAVRRRGGRGGFSLMEVLVATSVVALSLFPVMSYFTTLQMSGEAEEGDTEAVSIAANIVENIISPTVPFDAIRPAGDGTPGTDGLTRSVGNVPQAAFTEERWERLVSDNFSSGDRIKVSRKGVRYKVYFFAGVYHDRPNRTDTRGPDSGASIPDVSAELTFSYLPGPYGDRAASEFWKIDPAVAAGANNQKVLPAAPPTLLGQSGFSPAPYLLTGFQRSAAAGPGFAAVPATTPWYYTDRQNYFKIPGWPQSPLASGYRVRDPDTGFDARAELATKLTEVATRAGPTAPTWGYHPVTVDQGKFLTAGRGALMKVVVGIKYRAYNFGHAASTRSEHEFWLVSLKARLEDV
jgi:hypothetical protein